MIPGTRFLTVHKLHPVKFKVIFVNGADLFPYSIEAYEIQIRNVWVPCKYKEDVSLRWFTQRLLEIIS